MKTLYHCISLLSVIFVSSTNPAPDTEPALNPEHLFDFWVGEWDLTWETAEGDQGKGVNQIVKILDGKVIQENFESLSPKGQPALKGMSLSVYHPQTKTWRQAWADNQGGYYDFTGQTEGDKRIFVTQTKTTSGNTVHLRMIFKDIEEEAFTWDWESSEDEGKTWQRRWRIFYQRKK